MSEASWAVLLAAGGSRRLGFPKQLVSIDGRVLVRRQVEALGPRFDGRLVVVTGCASGEVRAALDGSGALLVHNEGWREGMGRSIAAGVGALAREADRVLLATCDQARLAAADYGALIEAALPDRCAAAGYGGVVGIPAVFPRRLFGALRALDQDRGARAILQAEADLSTIDLPAAAFDLDTPADLAAIGGLAPSDPNR